MKDMLVQTVKKNIPDALFGAVGGSVSLGLDNKFSDVDYYVITNQMGQTDVELIVLQVEGKDIDFMCVNIQTIIDKIKEYRLQEHSYPTCFYRGKNVESQIIKLKDYERPDFPREIVMRIFLSDKIIEFSEGSIQKYYGKIKEGLMKIDIWDYHFTRAYGNYQNYIKNKEEVLVRKYLYTIHELCTCDWILNRDEKMPMEFQKLISEQQDGWLIDKAQKLQEINQKAISKKEKQKIVNDKDLNIYIEDQLKRTLSEMKALEKNLSESYLEVCGR